MLVRVQLPEPRRGNTPHRSLTTRTQYDGTDCVVRRSPAIKAEAVHQPLPSVGLVGWSTGCTVTAASAGSSPAPTASPLASLSRESTALVARTRRVRLSQPAPAPADGTKEIVCKTCRFLLLVRLRGFHPRQAGSIPASGATQARGTTRRSSRACFRPRRRIRRQLSSSRVRAFDSHRGHEAHGAEPVSADREP
jgi:hypothetical protein